MSGLTNDITSVQHDIPLKLLLITIISTRLRYATIKNRNESTNTNISEVTDTRGTLKR